MSSLDDLIAAKLGAPVAAATPAASAPQGAPTGLDALISARLAGTQLPSAPPPEPSRTLSEGISDLGTAAGHHVLKLADGIGQLGEHAITGLFNLLPDNPVSRAISKQNAADDRQSSDWEAAYQKSVPNGPWATTGAVLGEVAPFALEAPAKGLKWVGNGAEALVGNLTKNKLIGKAINGGAQGAVVGASQPVTNEATLSDLVTGREPEDFWSQKGRQIAGGSTLGAALPVAATGVGAAFNAGRRALAESPILNPSTYAARQMGVQLGADAPKVAVDLANAPQYVPGSIPTTAQAGAHPRLVQLEKALSNQSPDFKAQLLERENQNNAARLQAVAEVAKTPEALQAAIDSRNAATAPMRARTVDNGNPVPIGGVSGALSSVANGAQGVSDTIGPAATAMGRKLDSFASTVPPDTLMNVPGSTTASPAMLDALRQNVNTYLAKNAPNGFVGTQEQAAMMPVKSAIIDAIDAANPRRAPGAGGWGQGMEQAGPTAPGYRDYLAEFAKRSVPVNTMEVGQQLQSKLLAGGLNSAGDAATALPGYRSALAQALRNSDYAIDPQAQASLEAVQSDLQRATISNSVRAGGSDTAYNAGAGKQFLRAVGAADASNVPAAMAGAGTLAATGSTAAAAGAAVGAKKAGGWVTNRVTNAMGDLLLDPQKLAEALSGSSQPLSATSPSAFGRLTRGMTPAAKAALIGRLMQSQAPQVIGADPQKAYAGQ